MSTSIAPSGYRLDGLAPPDARTDARPLRKRAQQRRWRLTSLSIAVLLPTALAGAYLYCFAANQYVTEFRFSVRHEAPLRMDAAANSAVAASLGGGSGGGVTPLAVIMDSQIVIQYLKSRQVVDDIVAAGVDLDAIYASGDTDFLAHLRPHTSVEARQRYWRGMVDPFFDMTTGIVSVEVRAFAPADAQLIAATTLRLSENLINGISNRAHDDVLAYANREVADSEAKLKTAQAAIAAYRNQHTVLFPEMQATADTLIEGKVQDSLIEAKTAYNTQLAQGASRDAMQMRMLGNRIAAMESALRGVHGRLARSDPGATGDASLASLISEYGVLHLGEEIAAKVYERALMALQDARNAASQQGVYLATFVHPGLPQESLYPIRWRLMLEAALLSFVGWCLLQLLYHGIRDHID